MTTSTTSTSSKSFLWSKQAFGLRELFAVTEDGVRFSKKVGGANQVGGPGAHHDARTLAQGRRGGLIFYRD